MRGSITTWRRHGTILSIMVLGAWITVIACDENNSTRPGSGIFAAFPGDDKRGEDCEDPDEPGYPKPVPDHIISIPITVTCPGEGTGSEPQVFEDDCTAYVTGDCTFVMPEHCTDPSAYPEGCTVEMGGPGECPPPGDSETDLTTCTMPGCGLTPPDDSDQGPCEPGDVGKPVDMCSINGWTDTDGCFPGHVDSCGDDGRLTKVCFDGKDRFCGPYHSGAACGDFGIVVKPDEDTDACNIEPDGRGCCWCENFPEDDPPADDPPVDDPPGDGSGTGSGTGTGTGRGSGRW